MISNFRRFAGLMSLESNLCFSHFFSSGPGGNFGVEPVCHFKSMHASPRSGSRRSRRKSATPGCVRHSRGRSGAFRIEAERLEKTAEAVAQMRAEQEKPEDVKSRRERISKAA